MFIDRTPRGEDPWLDLKVWSFTLGALLAFAGIYLDASWLIWVAIVVLLVGFAARFFPDGGEGPEPSDPDAGEAASPETPPAEKPPAQRPPAQKPPPEKPPGTGPVPEHE